MGRSRRKQFVAPRGWRAGILVAIALLFLVGRSARTSLRPDSPRGLDRSPLNRATPRSAQPAQERPPEVHQDSPVEVYSDAEGSAAANRLFASVRQMIDEDGNVPRFARNKIHWLIAERNAGRLSITLLKNITNTNLDVEDLMASGRVEGRPVVVIAQPRFQRFLVEGGRMLPPFSQQQKNDFMLGLVHETVHLQRLDPGNPADLEDRLIEELRTWREVDVNVVRQMRELNQPMNERLIEADDAIRSCGNEERCQPLREILLPSERRR